MPKTEQQLRDDIIRVGRLIFDKGWIAANDGHAYGVGDFADQAFAGEDFGAG